MNELFDGVVMIHTDGACSGNPGPGGWGILIIYPDGSEQRIKGGTGGDHTTNNRMELRAMHYALREVEKLLRSQEYCTHQFILHTDSSYVHKGLTQWCEDWAKRGWSKVKNPDLWAPLYALYIKLGVRVKVVWEKGHNDTYGNDQADLLARQGMNESVYRD